jgi:hypothetical protein
MLDTSREPRSAAVDASQLRQARTSTVTMKSVHARVQSRASRAPRDAGPQVPLRRLLDA